VRAENVGVKGFDLYFETWHESLVYDLPDLMYEPSGSLMNLERHSNSSQNQQFLSTLGAKSCKAVFIDRPSVIWIKIDQHPT
jgi:hypothetical protein